MPTLDEASFARCYRRVFPIVLAKCGRMLRGDAEAKDVAQEVFIRLWQHRELVEDHQSLTAWLYRTSTRLVIDRARRRAFGRESLGHLQAVLEGRAEADSESLLASREQLQGVLSACPAAELEAAILNRVDRLSHPEVAEVLGVSERTVRRLLARFDDHVRLLKESA
ncbi:MAG: sigma-70 family RNA polymerase sigma factor [Myxococcales bacterium]|nr:MAG: sigma-70 family RNA polymerase sigma factor [Myxococcales bacterium]